jgi:hypothetical protein
VIDILEFVRSQQQPAESEAAGKAA